MTSVLGAEAIRVIRLVARLSFYFSSTAARANWFPRMEFWFWIRLNAAGSAYLAVFPRFISERAGERDRNQESDFDVLPDLQNRKTQGSLRATARRLPVRATSSVVNFRSAIPAIVPQVLAPALIPAGASDKCQRSIKTGHFSLANERVVLADFVDLSHPIREVH